MKKRILGNTDLQTSILGMGCWQYGGGTYWGAQDQQDVNEVVHQAIELGINYFDTAEVYNDGESEVSLGIALQGRRDQVLIGSKVSTSNIRPEVLKQHCENSLRRLQTEYIDLYMLHWPITPLAIKHFSDDPSLIAAPPTATEVFTALEELKREGKIRHYGVSNHGLQQLKEVQDAGFTIGANELPYNLLSRAIEAHILPYCAEHSIGVIGYMPLQQGLLSGKYSLLEQVKPMQARSRHFHHSLGSGSRHGEEGASEEIVAALDGIRKLADELGVHMIELSLAWSMANEAIATTIVGSRNVEQLLLNARGAQLQLDATVIQALSKLTEPVLTKLGNNPDYYENRNHSRIY